MSSDYYINDRHDQYSQVMSVIKERLIQVQGVKGKETSEDYYKLVLAELEENGGSNITVSQFNAIIRALLEFVPEDIKNKHY